MPPSFQVPESKTVIAMDVLVLPHVRETIELELEKRLNDVTLFASSLQSVRKPVAGKLFLLFPHTGVPVLPLLKSLVSALDGLQRNHAYAAIRMLVHHGLVFMQDLQGQKVHLGSGTRTVQTILQRSPERSFYALTPGFAALANIWQDIDMTLTDLPGSLSSDRLQRFEFRASALGSTLKPERVAFDDEQMHAMIKRLAGYVGPIASALVDDASLRARSNGDLIKLLSNEIHDASERLRFERDVLVILER